MYDILTQLSATNSKLDKISILSSHKNNDVLKRVLTLALCPYTQFYIKRVPAWQNTSTCTVGLESGLDILEHLFATRKVSGANEKLDILQKLASGMSQDDYTVLTRVLLKDLRCGVAEGTVNKVFPGLIKTYPCLLAIPFEGSVSLRNIKYPAICQLKSDGLRINVLIRNNSVEYRGRSGKPLFIGDTYDSLFLDIYSRIKDRFPDGIVLDGELLVYESITSSKILNRQTGNGIASRAIHGTIQQSEVDRLVFDLWDLIPFTDFVNYKSAILYSDRLDLLKKCVDDNRHVRIIESTIVHSIDEASEIYQRYISMGLEGAMLKNLDTIWEDKRSKSQVKFKAELECEVLVVGINPGTGKYTGLIGSLECKTADDVQVSISGFDDEFRHIAPSDIVGKIISVKYNTVTEDTKTGVKSLFLPRFIEVRYDKTEPDYVLK